MESNRDFVLSSLLAIAQEYYSYKGELSYDKTIYLINVFNIYICYDDKRVRRVAEKVLFGNIQDSPLAADTLLSNIDKLSEEGIKDALRIFKKAKLMKAAPVVINLIGSANRIISLEAADAIGILGSTTDLPLLRDILRRVDDSMLKNKLSISINRINNIENYYEGERKRILRMKVKEKQEAQEEIKMKETVEQMESRIKEMFASMTDNQKAQFIQTSRAKFGISVNIEGKIIGMLNTSSGKESS